MNTTLTDRLPRMLSLLSLLGLIGVAGLLEPQLARFSALSFLSYLCYFRFFRWFGEPRPDLDRSTVGIWLLGFLIACLAMVLSARLFSVSPLFGFIGFAGFCGLYDPRDASPTDGSTG